MIEGLLPISLRKITPGPQPGERLPLRIALEPCPTCQGWVAKMWLGEMMLSSTHHENTAGAKRKLRGLVDLIAEGEPCRDC